MKHKLEKNQEVTEKDNDELVVKNYSKCKQSKCQQPKIKPPEIVLVVKK